MIFVTVGSRNYPFDRLFKKLDELYEKCVDGRDVCTDWHIYIQAKTL